MTITEKYPYSQVPILPGDILYSPIGRSTYFVGHTVIIGTDFLVKESLPTRPSGYSTTIEHFWNRHRFGDTITLLRSAEGSLKASEWATRFVGDVKKYHLGNYNINNITKNYCSKLDRKSTRLNSSHVAISYAVFCLKKKKKVTVTL